MPEHTPETWRWGEDAGRAADQVDYDGDDEYYGEKFLDTQLYSANGRVVIPIRIDHYNMIYDGDWINDADRTLIAAAPDLLAACEAARAEIRVERGEQMDLHARLTAVIAAARGEGGDR